ncbi:unnamed protein product [Vitrella brassicaformis CCMP3155]|uniref:3-hydroxyisobutyrate dehydrogenase n=1 Tax=Vitrella brassicaformis (strain CCMP3155) TaxID=1169540 RepID=A0A0G4G8S5_VITBC|nr:unnamed protein product [Vitrella brassicaformis CCMP3155]|eukprot:CEM25244.1 unnamed protein product [Vitrella brassicaformis CCMP3155]
MPAMPKPLSVSPGSTRIGWIGTGVMGGGMCANCIRGGYSATVFDLSPSKCAPLVELGAQVAGSPKEVANEADVVFLCVGFPEDAEKAIVGADGTMEGLRPGGIIVDMTTSKPSLSASIAERVAQQGCYVIDAPVSGGDVGAREGRLAIFCGGDRSAFDAVRPLLVCMSKEEAIHHMGPAGSGQHMKITNQILVSINLIGVAEGLLYAHRAGLDVEKALAGVSKGAAGSWSLTNYGDRILRRDFKCGGSVALFVKDLRICVEEANRMGLALPGLALAHQLYVAMQAQGDGDAAIHGLTLALERLNGVKTLGDYTK